MVQVDDDPPEWEDTFADIGIDGFVREVAYDEDAAPTHTLYYDYTPPFVDCALANR